MPETSPRDPLLSLLLDRRVITADQARELSEVHASTGKPIRALAVDTEIIGEDRLLQVIADYMGTTVVNLLATDIPMNVVRGIPASVSRMYNVVPVRLTPQAAVLAVSDLVTPQITDELTFVLTRDVSFVLCRDEDLKNSVNQFYGDASDAVNEMLASLERDIEVSTGIADMREEDQNAVDQLAGSTPIIRFVNLVLYEAIQNRASDIHFEPFENEFTIRYRVDGALYAMAPPPKRLALPVISRLKVMASMNIAERRLPQDGRIQLTIAGRPIDLRVSTLPTAGGKGYESVVLRVLDRSVVSLELENLGMPDDVYESFLRDINKPNGIIIVTGPTGSGKTTTLYSALRVLNKVDTKILTVEEPVEYDIEGIVQVAINEAAGVTFDRILRSFLRQDPDVMMVGEIRDLITAQTAIQASLTGHLVFSTLHTNDAAGAITRLIDMGTEPYLITSTVEAIVGQRLVRTICENCKTAYKPTAEVLNMLEMSAADVGDREFYYGAGCAACNETGYKGRKGIYEYLAITDPIRELINARQPTLVLRNKAVETGMRTMRQDGLRNVLDGYTTIEEVLKYT